MNLFAIPSLLAANPYCKTPGLLNAELCGAFASARKMDCIFRETVERAFFGGGNPKAPAAIRVLSKS